ncbi:hypothetical protein CUMW_240030 [Citrus unshiu]|uniref:ABC transporter domain-containing protein n=1 Tax=Citrus unshiu TaxID=55188 RepID=A0A2H5QL09_CITUN|nr:hypothetical protein CUMW_240030 [Citrus unshiu]
METNHTTESIRHRHAYSGDRENDNTPAVLAHLVWEEVKVEAKNLRNGAKKKLINSLSGYAQPDRIMAIMGPSGSGKSTFLDALAGRLSKNVIMTGSVQLNRKKGGTNRRDIGAIKTTRWNSGRGIRILKLV